MNELINIKNKIYTIRGQQVMFDNDLAELYGYEVKRLNEQVKRNIDRFPEDFMFQLTFEEALHYSRSQNATLERKGSNLKYAPYVFTEQGVYMLATVLKSETAINQSILIMRTFKEMRHYINNNYNLFTNNELLRITQNERDIQEIKNKMITKEDFDDAMKQFISPNQLKEYLILNGQKIEANIAYEEIYNEATKSIFVIDTYIGSKTYSYFKNIDSKIKIIIFSENASKAAHLLELSEFIEEYPNVNIKLCKTNKHCHDRYIIIDFDTENEKIYHCGASSNNAGNKITTITQLNDLIGYHHMLEELLIWE